MLAAMLLELGLRKHYLDGETIETIYFGGGTPSLLERVELDAVFEKIHSLFHVAEGVEITLEANPDDLNPLKISELRRTPVNRLSIGVQSFSEEDLRWMNRSHNAAQALACLENALAAGFSNLSADLIYGSPLTSDEQWERNLDTLLQLNIPHLSCYCLTVEEKTALARFIKTGKAPPVDEDRAIRHFEHLVNRTLSAGYEHYEISNFALPGCHSRHNSSYWSGAKYLGIGPSAHSFDGVSRQWNVANNARYLHSMASGEACFEKEILTPEQRYNEYVMTSLRTAAGCDLEKIRAMGAPFEAHFLGNVQVFLANETVVNAEGRHFKLTRQGKLLADGIAAELFV